MYHDKHRGHVCSCGLVSPSMRDVKIPYLLVFQLIVAHFDEILVLFIVNASTSFLHTDLDSKILTAKIMIGG